MVRVTIVGPERFAECLALRMEVFVEEQKVPRDEEEDGLDPECTHFLATAGGEAIGTARLRLLRGDGKAERVAVRAAARGRGIGRALMEALEAEALRLGAEAVHLNAQLAAIPFYEALGYTARGPEFLDAGIPHRAMTKQRNKRNRPQDQHGDNVEVMGLIDTEALARWMDAQRLPGAGEPLEARPVGGGASNELFEIRRGNVRMALRRPPRIVPKGRNETMQREYRVIAALADSGVPHTRAIASCDDTSVLGACFYLMDFVDGWSPMAHLNRWPEPFHSDLSLRPGLAFELVDAIAKLGNVDWRARGLEGFGRPEGFHERQVDRWLAHLEAFRFREIPGLDVAAEWLRRHKPRTYEPGILHGDYQFANVMFQHGAPARMAAVVDWEMATVGDPLLDLAWVVMGWPDEGEDRAGSGYVDYTGMPNRAGLLERYASVSGRPVEDIDYYVVLARFKMAVVLEGGYARYVTGGAENPKMEAFGPIVLQMAERAAELARQSTLPPRSTVG